MAKNENAALSAFRKAIEINSKYEKSYIEEARILSKVIFENCYLTKEEIRQCALIAKEVKPDFIKLILKFL